MDRHSVGTDYGNYLSVWKCRGYLDDASVDSLSLRELLKYFRQLDKIKQRYSEQIEVESAISDTDFSEISVFTTDPAEDDSGVSVLTSDTPRKRSKVLSLREEQKLEREAIRRKLAFGGDSDDEGDNNGFGLEKSWSNLDHSFSANSQSLHICYINESCSSDESADEVRPPASLPAFFPTSSPTYSSKISEKKPDKSVLSTDTSSCSSSSGPSSIETESRTTSKHHDHDGSCSNQAKCKELELETRFQLAQAQQKAKAMAAEEKRKQKREHRSSLAQRLLSDTLPEDTAAKMKSYSLTNRDCRCMTVGQLQLILNDMHSKKQALNEELMMQLIARDDLQTEQDAKLIDVEDAKTMLNAMGPETTV